MLEIIAQHGRPHTVDTSFDLRWLARLKTNPWISFLHGEVRQAALHRGFCDQAYQATRTTKNLVGFYLTNVDTSFVEQLQV